MREENQMAFYGCKNVEESDELIIAALQSTAFDVEDLWKEERGDPWDADTIFHIQFEGREMPFFLYDPMTFDRPMPLLSVGLRLPISPDQFEDAELHEKWLNTVVNTLSSLSIALNSEYAPIHITGKEGKPIPESKPLWQSVNELPEIGVYSQGFIENLGGLESAFDDPWYVAHLTDGSVLVIRDDEPWADEGWTPPREAEYIDHATITEQEAETAADQPAEPTGESPPELVEPFATLDDGAYGTDYGVAPDDITDEFTNERLRLERVYRDGDYLRRVDDAAIVRRVVDDQPDEEATIRAMVEDLPPGAESEDVLASALLHEAIPPEFVRLDDPDGENVVTRVADLDLDFPKYDLLLALAARTGEGSATDEAVADAEELLEQIENVAHIDGVEKFLDGGLF